MKSADLLPALSPAARASVERQLSRPVPAPRKTARPACPVAARTSEKVLAKEIVLGIRTRSLNSREHWTAKAKRVKAERRAVDLALLASAPLPALPVRVTLTRCGPRELDSHDNLRGSLKGTADSIAAFYGVADKDPRIEWVYAPQIKGDYAVGVKIERKDGL